MKPIQVLKDLYIRDNQVRFPSLPEGARVAPRYSDKTANGLTACIIDFIRLTGGRAYRINVQGQFDEKLRKWRLSGMRRGIPDIIGCLQGGQFIGIEVKIAGDRQSEHQLQVQNELESVGGIYLIVKTFDDFYNWFQKQQDRPQSEEKMIKNMKYYGQS